MSELLARIDALARRGDAGNSEANTKLKLADLELDRMTRRVTRNGKKIELTAREFQLLEFMMRHSGQVVTRTMLLEGVWDYHFRPANQCDSTCISAVWRQAIDKDFDKPLLHTVRGADTLARRRIAELQWVPINGFSGFSTPRRSVSPSFTPLCSPAVAAALLGAVDFAVSRWWTAAPTL